MPQPRNLANEYRRTLQAQHYALPMQFMDEATFGPLFQSSNLQQLDYLLNGSPEMNFTYYDWQKPTFRNVRSGRESGGGILSGIGGLPGMGGGGGFPGLPGMGGGGGGFPGLPGLPGMGGNKMGFLPGMGGGGGGGFDFGGMFGGGDDDKPQQRMVTPGQWLPREVTRGPQRGLLSLYEESILPSQIRQATMQREADIADVQALGPRAREALRTADPESAGLLDRLNAQAGSELDMEASLDPSLFRLVSQGIRGRQQGTLLANGNAGAYSEALGLSEFGQNLRNQRRGFAGDVIARNQSFYGNPFQAILGRSNGSAALPIAGQAAGIGGQAGPRLTNFESPYAADLYNTNFNQAVAQAIADKNRQYALIGAGIQAAGSLAGGAMGAFCWVAREVFGTDTLRDGTEKWKAFREWLLLKAPADLIEAYGRNGPAAAQRVRRNPGLKARLRAWMEEKIGEVLPHGHIAAT
jgi:hypothetical protein